MPSARSIMLQGTGSSVGKSLLVTALCRIFTEDGFSVAPYKSQNMALNSTVTPYGEEIGIAQAIQAKACNRIPDSRMNPVLLKPTSTIGSQVIVKGVPIGTMTAKEYFAYKPTLFPTVCSAYDSLASEADIVVIEGAGSPAEINLRTHDIVNMAIAQYTKSPVLLVANIDTGGAFASLVGTMELLRSTDKERVTGFIINNFRGDKELLTTALEYTEYKTKVPFLGVIPHIAHAVPEEDTVHWKTHRTQRKPNTLTIGIVDMPYASNLTDFAPLLAHPEISIQKISSPQDIQGLHAIIIGGSKHTYSDLQYLHKQGIAQAILAYKAISPVHILGICGGMQMLGSETRDEEDSTKVACSGLSLLDLTTTFHRVKHTMLQEFTYNDTKQQCTFVGYEIHHGRTECTSQNTKPLFFMKDGTPVGYSTHDGSVWGTYTHGLFDTNTFCMLYLTMLCERHCLPHIPPSTYSLEKEIIALAYHVRKHLNMKKVYELIGK